MIKECHGDLHLRNIFFTHRPHLTDCIEFNDDFRIVDVVRDISFLAMDLEANGHWSFAELFVKRYAAHFGDEDLNLLLPFYKCWASSVRSMVALLNSRDAVSESEYAALVEEAKRYLDISSNYSLFLESITG
jgi:aminoglycoside phosphotransferase family enzyme